MKIKWIGLIVFAILFMKIPAYAGVGHASEIIVSSSQVETATIVSSTYSPTYQAQRSIIVYLNVTAASGTGGLTVRVIGVDPASGNSFYLNAAPTAVTATGQYAYVLGPGLTNTGGSVAQTTSTQLPTSFVITVIAGDSSSYTYSVGLSIGD